MPFCNHCGGHISASFARVFGSDDSGVENCPDCSTWNDIWGGRAYSGRRGHSDGGGSGGDD